MKVHTQDELLDKYIGKIGEPTRSTFEYELKVDLIGDFIKDIRKKKHYTLDILSQIIGFDKSIVAKMEKKSTDIPLDILERAFPILKSIYDKQYEVVTQSSAVLA
jgi:hypothetical protein